VALQIAFTTIRSETVNRRPQGSIFRLINFDSEKFNRVNIRSRYWYKLPPVDLSFSDGAEQFSGKPGFD
jgi:hypothetical protein